MAGPHARTPATEGLVMNAISRPEVWAAQSVDLPTYSTTAVTIGTAIMLIIIVLITAAILLAARTGRQR